jgi:cytochrome c553
MKLKFKSIIFTTIILGTISIAATLPQNQQVEEEYKATNLKILPKDMTYHQIDSVMDNFKAALGVKCDYCHARQKDNPKKFDYASDELEHKIVSRDMMKMTNKINKKYFKSHEGNEAIGATQCMTCHRGQKKPEFQLRPPKVQKQ